MGFPLPGPLLKKCPFHKELFEIHVLQTHSLFACGILCKLLCAFRQRNRLLLPCDSDGFESPIIGIQLRLVAVAERLDWIEPPERQLSQERKMFKKRSFLAT